MKKLLAIVFAAAVIAVSSISGHAERLSISESGGKGAVSPEPFASVFSVSTDGHMEVFSGASLAALVPIQLDRFVISLLDVTTDDDPFKPDKKTTISRFHLNTGVKTESYLTDSQSMLMDELFGSHKGSTEIASSVVFIGIGLDFMSGYLKGDAFLGRPLNTLSNKLYNTNSSARTQNKGINTGAHGFEASAGYQLNEMVALGAGLNRMTDTNQETDRTEEIYAVYAQAILAVAPGVQVKPEVGQVERIKETSETETIDASFYAGAIWEINF